MTLSKVSIFHPFLNGMKEGDHDPPLPIQTTAFSQASDEARQAKRHLLQATEADSMQPASKRICTTSRQFHRVPCKARFMSETHNSDTAFFDIPVDASHGLLLRCSHPECATSGRQFRYCKECVQPVAKRNFPMRHGHGMIIRSAKDPEEVDSICDGFMGSTSFDQGKCHPCGGDASVTAAFTDATRIIPPSANMDSAPSHRPRMVSFDRSASKHLVLGEAQQHGSFQRISQQQVTGMKRKSFDDLNSTEKEWMALLQQRPDLEQETIMSIWMDKIISFSAAEKGSALKRSRATQLMFRSDSTQECSFPQPSETTVTTPLTELGDASAGESTFFIATTNSSSCLHAPPQTVSPSCSYEANLDLFDDTKSESVNEKQAQADQIMLTFELEEAKMASEVSEFASALDDVDITTLFD